MTGSADTGQRGRRLVEASAFGLGMVLFALCSHRGWPWIAAGAAGLVAAAFSIQSSCAYARDIPALFGLSALPLKVIPIGLAGSAAGFGLGVFYRVSFGMAAVPPSLEPFVLAACAIGAAEELVYRGWMQGRLRILGRPAAILIAAAAHAAYKTALFALPASPIGVDYRLIAAWTLGAGALFGLLRELSDGVLPPVAAHVTFDLLVYGAVARAPWWVWT